MDINQSVLKMKRNPFLIRPARSLPKEFAVVGAGTIGPDIAYYLKSSMPQGKLTLVDISEEALKKAEKRFGDYAGKAVQKRMMTEENAKAILGNIVYTSDYAALANCDLVIEAATENLDLKRVIFEKLEANVRKDAILASNTSSIPGDRIFTKLKHVDRAAVTHFFAPAWRNPSVEVVHWGGIADETLEYLYWFFGNTGKVPVLTANVISFMYNRIFENWCNEATYLLESATAAEINSVAEEFVAAGPFTVLNMANGNPLVHEANTRKMEEGEHYRPAKILLSVEKWSLPRPGSAASVPEPLKSLIRDRLMGLLFSQSFDIIDRGIGTREDLNLGAVLGLGFRKGPLDLMREIGDTEVNRISKKFTLDRPGFPEPKKPLSEYQKFSRYLLVDDMDGTKVITIRRPQAMNALNQELIDEILAVLEKHTADPAVKGFVITGYGNQAFSAGMDIGNFGATLGNLEVAYEFAKAPSEKLSRFDKIGKPIVAAINGMALGGGLELAMRCRSLVAVKGATFQFPEITLGILPGMGGCAIPYRKWPKGAALFSQMICLAKKINVSEAMSAGLVTSVADDYAGMISEAIKEVEKLAGTSVPLLDAPVEIPAISIPDEPKAGSLPLSREAIQVTVDTIRKAAGATSLNGALEANYRGAGAISCLDSAREGITAFMEKRKPAFLK